MEEKFDFRNVEASSPWDHQVKILGKVSTADNNLGRHAQVGHSWYYNKWKWKKCRKKYIWVKKKFKNEGRKSWKYEPFKMAAKAFTYTKYAFNTHLKLTLPNDLENVSQT